MKQGLKNFLGALGQALSETKIVDNSADMAAAQLLRKDLDDCDMSTDGMLKRAMLNRINNRMMGIPTNDGGMVENLIKIKAFEEGF